MKCPYCGYKESKVIDSRPAEEGSSIRRRRECLSCAKRFTTYETVESLRARLGGMYGKAEVGNVKSIAWFVCRKESDGR